MGIKNKRKMKIATLVGLAAILQNGTSVELQTQYRDTWVCNNEEIKKTQYCRDDLWNPYFTLFLTDRFHKVPVELIKVMRICRSTSNYYDFCDDVILGIAVDYQTLALADETIGLIKEEERLKEEKVEARSR